MNWRHIWNSNYIFNCHCLWKSIFELIVFNMIHLGAWIKTEWNLLAKLTFWSDDLWWLMLPIYFLYTYHFYDWSKTKIWVICHYLRTLTPSLFILCVSIRIRLIWVRIFAKSCGCWGGKLLIFLNHRWFQEALRFVEFCLVRLCNFCWRTFV